MGIWFSHEECVNLLEYLDDNKSGEIDAAEFDTKINALQNRKYKKDTWLVTKCAFLTAIADVYD